MRSDWFPRRDSRSWCTIAEHEGSTTLPGALPPASPDQLPPRLAGLDLDWTAVPPLVRTEWDWPYQLGP
jgi:hypothetical protein